MKVFGKMYLMIILKVRKNKGFTPSLENTVLGEPWGGDGGGSNYLLRFKRWALSTSRHGGM